MPKTSRDSATTVLDQGPVSERSSEVDDFTASFVAFHVDIDGAPLLRGLPGDRCACPHWGYVFTGSATFTYADRIETYEAGDAFYAPPGHTPAHSADSEILIFSSTQDLAPTNETMRRNFQAMLASQPGA